MWYLLFIVWFLRKLLSKKCTHVAFPNHPMARFRQPCNTVLMKKMTSANGTKNYLYTKRVYCYRSIKSSLEEMLLRAGFKDILHHSHNKSNLLLADVCNSQIFRNFQDDLGNNYFADKRNQAIMLNIDWFNPFKTQNVLLEQYRLCS